MKKTLIALAAIAAVGAASAQVTVYGQLDVGINNTSAGGTVVGISGLQTSRFGVKAAQALGGVTVSAVLEGEIGAGTAVFKGFDRTAKIGIGGSFGTVTMGNQWTPFDNAVWTADSLEYSKFTPLAGMQAAWWYDVGNTGMGNAKNSLQYATPDMNGFQAFVLVAPNVNANTQGSTNYSGIGLNYSKGPLTINFATQSMDGSFKPASDGWVTPATKAAQVATPTNNSNIISVQYNLGMATIAGGLVNNDTGAGETDRGYILGVKVPMGADSVSVGFSSNKNSVGGKDTTKGAWSAQYVKAIGKAAQAYFGIQSVDSVNKTGAGLRLNF